MSAAGAAAGAATDAGGATGAVEAASVLRIGDRPTAPLRALFAGFGLELVEVPAGVPIPGSYWGESEAGLVADRVYVRPDTPVHSALHEACHAICMGDARRAALRTDAGGDYDEENAVCYLQIVLAGRLPGVGRDRVHADMDAWGYTFRLGSARAWFERDAADARDWLACRGLPIA
jgi:hypothetical protein